MKANIFLKKNPFIFVFDYLLGHKGSSPTQNTCTIILAIPQSVLAPKLITTDSGILVEMEHATAKTCKN